VRLLTARVAAGHPTIVLRVTDAGAGVDPYSLTFGYRGRVIGASDYDPDTGLAVVPLPREAPPLGAGTTRARVRAADFQETKNVNTAGSNIFPNTRFARLRIHVVEGPAITWLQASCSRLLVAASSTQRLLAVRVTGVGSMRPSRPGLYSLRWHGSGPRRLRAVLVDTAGRSASARTRACH
jgi:hypothetical protein